MRKFLSVVSLLMIATMILATPAVSAADSEWKAPEGINIYTANYMSVLSPMVDGIIDEGEYGEPLVKVTKPVAASNDTWGTTWETNEYDENLRSQSMELYVAHDEDNIYIGIYEVGGEQQDDGMFIFRNNYWFQFGFDLNKANSFYQFGGFQTNAQWSNQLRFYDGGKLKVSSVLPADLIDECMVRKHDSLKNEDVAFGDFSFANGNVNMFSGNWTTTFEFKISKENLKEIVKNDAGVELDSIDGMWIGLFASAYKGANNTTDSTQYWKWFGTTDISGKQDDYAAYGITSASWRERAEFKVDSMFDLVLFEDAPVETEAPTTEAPATEAPVTEAPAGDVTEAPAGDVTEAPTTEPTKGGCGASVTLAGLALVAALGTCTAFVAKKKED